MIHSLLLSLRPLARTLIHITQGYRALSLFLELVRSFDPVLASRLHTEAEVKPFTVSPLGGKLERTGDKLAVLPDETYSLRLTLLDEHLLGDAIYSLLKLPQGLRLNLDKAAFSLVAVAATPMDSPEAAFTRYSDIAGKANDSRRLTLNFLSPVAFRSKGKRNVVFPEAGLVFGSLLTKWNAFSAVKFEDSIKDTFPECIVPSQYRLETRILDFVTYKEIGFEGVCSYTINSGVNKEAVRQINALADFAFYSGVGAKTTMGMGQTRRIV